MSNMFISKILNLEVLIKSFGQPNFNEEGAFYKIKSFGDSRAPKIW